MIYNIRFLKDKNTSYLLVHVHKFKMIVCVSLIFICSRDFVFFGHITNYHKDTG